jgi:hypothetical protein
MQMQSFEAAAGGSLSVQDFRDLHTQLSPIIKKAMYDMIVAGAHSQAPHLRLTWLSKRFQSEADSLSGGRTVAAADTVEQAALSDNTSAVAGSPMRFTVFDDLVSCMGRIVLPPADDSHMSAPVASQVAIMRQNFTKAHGSALECILNMQSAWSSLATVCTGVESPPEAANTDALKAKIRDLELQLAEARLAVNKTSSDAHFQKLSDAAVSSLKRQNKKIMGDVYNRHAKPIGLSARALMTALHAFDPSSFPADVSDGDAANKLKELDTSNKGYCNFKDFCSACKPPSDADAAQSPARDVFLRLADVNGLTAEALMDALKEVDAPVLSSSEGRSPEQIFRRADSNLSGSVDFAESDPPSSPLPSPPLPSPLPSALLDP